jgi:glycosyltransferase involved in cell wall biosynthesis
MTGKMNILLLHDHWITGGAEKLTINLINIWRTLGHNISLVSCHLENPVFKELDQGENDVYIYPRKFRYDLRMVWKVRKLIKEKNIQIIVALDGFDFLIIRLASLFLYPRPCIVLTLHSTQPASKYHFFKSFIFTRFLTKTEHLLSICETQKNYWSKTFKIPESKFTTIYNGIDTDYFSPDPFSRKSIRNRLGILEDAFVVIQVASLLVHKRHEISIQALKIVSETCTSRDFKLLIVGGNDNSREETLNELIKKLHLEGSILLLGKQFDVRPYYQAADLFTLSSSAIETFSIAALEAMSTGLPCVLTDIGGASEMIQEKFNGYLVPIENPQALAEAWLLASGNDDTFNHQLIRNNIVDHFNINDCALNYLALFQELCSDE